MVGKPTRHGGSGLKEERDGGAVLARLHGAVQPHGHVIPLASLCNPNKAAYVGREGPK